MRKKTVFFSETIEREEYAPGHSRGRRRGAPEHAGNVEHDFDEDEQEEPDAFGSPVDDEFDDGDAPSDVDEEPFDSDEDVEDEDVEDEDVEDDAEDVDDEDSDEEVDEDKEEEDEE